MLPIIALYNNERGRKAKLFYIFYPAHLIILMPLIDLKGGGSAEHKRTVPLVLEKCKRTVLVLSPYVVLQSPCARFNTIITIENIWLW